MATVIRSLDPTAQASATSIKFKQLNLETAPAQRPEVIAVLAQAADAKTVTANVPVLADGTSEEAFALYGASPLYYASAKLFPKSGNGAKCPVYYVPIGVTTGVVEEYTSAAGTSGTQVSRAFTAQVRFRETAVSSAADAVGKIATNAQNNPARSPRGIALDGFNTLAIPFSVPSTATISEYYTAAAAAINAEAHAPFTAVVDDDLSSVYMSLTSKWSGSTAADLVPYLVLEDGSPMTDVGCPEGSFTVAGNAAGTFDIETALDNLTEQYGITRIVNQFDDTTNLDLLQDWGEAKRDSLVSQFAIAYSGREYDESGTVAGTVDVSAIKTLGDARRDDAVNSWIYGTYGDLRELTYTQRDTLLKAGISNIQLKGGVATLMDSVTLYHPEGVQNSIFTYDDSICKEGNIAYDLRNFFEQDDWKSKIIVSTSSKTTNPDAIDITDYVAARNGRAELWEKTALIASADFVKENSVAAIDDVNPRRINDNIKTQLTSGLAITDTTLLTGFLFGESA